METDIALQLGKAKTIADIFEVVKAAVSRRLRQSRGGLMLGLADLGNQPGGFFGAFYPVGTNIIVMNRIPMLRIKETQPELFNPYVFHVLLHEYLHSLGYLDEGAVRNLSIEISQALFGKEHPATRIAQDTIAFFPNLVYPDILWRPENVRIELVEGFDRGSASYIG